MGIGMMFWRGMWGRIRLIFESGEGGVGVGFRNGLIFRQDEGNVWKSKRLFRRGVA